MPHSLDLEIREHLADYLAGMMSLRDFEDWFFPATTDVHRSGDPFLDDLVYTIKLDWAEYTNGDVTEDELRDELRPLVTQPTVEFTHPSPETSVHASASSVTVADNWSLREVAAFNVFAAPPPPPPTVPRYPTFTVREATRAS